MDADTLLPVLAERLDAADIADEAKLLVYAAYESDEQLRGMAAGAVGGELPDLPTPEPVAAPRTYLSSIAVAGFRGIGPEQTLRLQPGPGLTLVVGRNGSGKSSFAEAAEVALTGRNARWAAGRGAVWKEGWRNLHADPEPASVTVDLTIDGEAGVTRVRREWTGDDVDDCAGWIQRAGQQRAGLDTLDWSAALATYRPFLSYSELGSMLQGPPSALYDALASILGLEPLAAAEKRLKAALKTLDDDAKRVTAEKNRLVAALEGIDDERARRTAAALRIRQPDLDAVAELLRADSAAAAQDLGPLRAWAAVAVPDPMAALAAAETLAGAQQRVEQVASTESGQALRLAELLEAALDHAAHSATTDCPVCGASDRLDADWRTATEAEVRRLRREAEAADQARRDLRAALAAAAAAAPAPPALAPVAGLPHPDLLEEWRAWSDAAREPSSTVTALRGLTPRLVEKAGEVAEAARAELARREDLWQPFAEQVAAFVPQARSARDVVPLRGHLKTGADWLRAQQALLRDERLQPLTDGAAVVWSGLRQESNVDLGPVRLEGTATRRRVALDVTVDGTPGAALGVMSQGELHALALSLFLPRATLPESPFRFLVIDDPVQAMDPAKVEGLARVLAETARTHQVIVFTHDDRLPEAVRRLQLPATIWQVARRERSVVELTKADDPVRRYLDDARALARTSELPPSVAERVVAGLCRSALEAGGHERIRRTRLARGERHDEVEAVLDGARTTNDVLALALLDDQGRGGDVLGRLNTYGRWAADAYQTCRKGPHAGAVADLPGLVTDIGRLAEKVRA